MSSANALRAAMTGPVANSAAAAAAAGPPMCLAPLAQPLAGPAVDAAFAVTKLRDGTGPTVLFANGFLSEGETGWGNFKPLIDSKFPQSPVCRVNWGAQQQLDFGSWLKASGQVVKGMLTGKAGASVSSLKDSLEGNPWTIAKQHAEQAGKQLADQIRALDPGTSVVLVGHSLGARLMSYAGLTLGASGAAGRLQEVHLTGAAISRDHDWGALNKAVSAMVNNYYSGHDPVLLALYGAAEPAPAVGPVGFDAHQPRISDHDYTAKVNGHSDYFSAVKLV
ncbi:MAG: DUF726 domain-containing protein [Cellulomonadaceae bacterium]|nr:DUF726 domain-containing protein [Cellulomonadaceae bacterium]